MTSVLIKENRTQCGSHVKTEPKNAGSCNSHQELGARHETDAVSEAPEETNPVIPYFGLLYSRAMK